jgi:hypothetical protein
MLAVCDFKLLHAAKPDAPEQQVDSIEPVEHIALHDSADRRASFRDVFSQVE